VIAIHLDIGAVPQEKGGFGTRRHLCAVDTAIAMEGRVRRLITGRCDHWFLRSDAAGVLVITVDRQSDNDGERYNSTKEVWLFIPAMGRCLALIADGRTSGAKKVLRPFLPFPVNLDFEREPFSDSWAMTIFRKCRDVNKDLRITSNWRDESEALIVIPLSEITFDAHIEKSNLELSRLRAFLRNSTCAAG